MTEYTIKNAVDRIARLIAQREAKERPHSKRVASTVEAVRRVLQTAEIEELRTLHRQVQVAIWAGAAETRDVDNWAPQEVTDWAFEDGALFTLELMVSDRIERANLELERLRELPRREIVRLCVFDGLQANPEFSAAAFKQTPAAERIKIRPDEISRALNDLTDRGLVRQIEGTSDRRVKLYALTEAGREGALAGAEASRT